MKIRTYSQQAAMKSIENSVLSMYKKAQLAETADPFIPLMVEIAEKMGFSVTEDEVKEFLEEADELLSEFGISKEMVMEKLESIKESISEMYEKFKSYLPDMDTEEELKEQVDQAKDGSYGQSNDAFDIAKGISIVKQVPPKAKNIFSYLTNGSVSIIKKVFGIALSLLFAGGYLVFPIDIIPDFLPGGWIDDVIIGIYIADYIFSFIGGDEYGKEKSDLNVVEDPKMPLLENEKYDEDEDEGIIIDVEAEEIDKESFNIIQELVKISNSLDIKGHTKLADETDAIIRKLI